MAAPTVQEKATEIRERAVFHKRQARRHKWLAREAMAELARFCAQNGIKFVEAQGEDE
jgi:hypothetical protein